MSYLRLPEALRVLPRHGGVVVVAVEPDRTCAVIAKGPKRDIVKLSRASPGAPLATSSPARCPHPADVGVRWPWSRGLGAALALSERVVTRAAHAAAGCHGLPAR